MLGSIFNFAHNLQTFLLSKHPFINTQIFFFYHDYLDVYRFRKNWMQLNN